jgi:hypothetical protein
MAEAKVSRCLPVAKKVITTKTLAARFHIVRQWAAACILQQQCALTLHLLSIKLHELWTDQLKRFGIKLNASSATCDQPAAMASGTLVVLAN